jgi:hypothetical protein
VRDDMLKRLALILLALEPKVDFDVGGCQSREAVVWQYSPGKEIRHRCPVVLERLVCKAAYFSQILVIAAAKQTQSINRFQRIQAVRRSQKPKKNSTGAQVHIGARPGDDERLSQLLFFEQCSRLKSIASLKNFFDAVKMKPQWMPQMALLSQPGSECFKLLPITGSRVSIKIPGIQISQHDDSSITAKGVPRYCFTVSYVESAQSNALRNEEIITLLHINVHFT